MSHRPGRGTPRIPATGASEEGTADDGERSARRDDRVLPATRVVAAVVIAILVTAFIALYLHPDETEHRFAWTIHPTMTPLLMGAGYGSAVYFYGRVLIGRRWHRVGLGFVPTAVFTWLLAIATILHWGKFHHGTLAFGLWAWIYFVTPFLVPAVWLWNRRHDPRTPQPGDALLPGAVRLALLATGALLLAIAAWMFLFPNAVTPHWPWMLTPLTARTVAGFIVLPGVSWLMMASDPRWSAGRIAVETVAIGLVLLLIAVARAWSDFDHANPLTWAYVGGLGATLLALVGLYVAMERRKAAAR